MPKLYSDDLRERVIEAVVAGASRREAAESFSLSASSAVRWVQRWRDTGSARAKLSGGSTSPLEEHVEWLLALVAEQPDLTLDEIVAAMRKQRIPGSRTAVWRFFEDIEILRSVDDGSRRTTEAPPRPPSRRGRISERRWCARNWRQYRSNRGRIPVLSG
jgi:transposase